VLKEALEKVIREFPDARQTSFTNHPLASYFRHDLPGIVKEACLPINTKFLTRGSAGLTVWNFCPWIAVLDPEITETPQEKYYPVFLFAEDMSGVFLSLNQGTERSSMREIQHRAAIYRGILGNSTGSPLNSIDLKATTSRTRKYEAGNICAYFYQANSIPDDYALRSDLARLIDLCHKLYATENSICGLSTIDSDPPEAYRTKEGRIQFKKHRERDQALARKAKQHFGYKCKACGFAFPTTYGDIGKQFIEAHHLVPIGASVDEIENDVNAMTVLCSNCHSMIHRYDDCSDLAGFREHIREIGKMNVEQQ